MAVIVGLAVNPLPFKLFGLLSISETRYETNTPIFTPYNTLPSHLYFLHTIYILTFLYSQFLHTLNILPFSPPFSHLASVTPSLPPSQSLHLSPSPPLWNFRPPFGIWRKLNWIMKEFLCSSIGIISPLTIEHHSHISLCERMKIGPGTILSLILLNWIFHIRGHPRHLPILLRLGRKTHFITYERYMPAIFNVKKSDFQREECGSFTG